MIEDINKILVGNCGGRANRLAGVARRVNRVSELSVKAVQADLPNRLEVLHFHGVVLSVKVKAKTASCMARLCMVQTEELIRQLPENRYRGVENNFYCGKIKGAATPRDRV